jgi:hypothetical protein
MGCEYGSCLSLFSSLSVSFPLTPTLSLGERENHLPRYDKSRRAGLSSDGRRGTLSPRERVEVRGKWCSDKPMLNLMAVTLALPDAVLG